MSKVNPAIILGGGSSNGIGLTRTLGRMGVPVYNVVEKKTESAIYSKYCLHSYFVPGVETTPQLLRQTLIKLGRRIQLPAVIFPATDSVVMTLSQVMHSLPQYVASIPSRENVQLLVNKKRFYASLREHDVPHPMTLAFPECSIEEIQKQLTFPLFIRPVYSQLFFALFRRKGFTAHNEQELKTYLKLIEHHQQSILVQEIIPGPVLNGYVLRGYFDINSMPKALLVAQILRQPSMFSDMSCMISVPRQKLQGFDKIVIKYLQNLRYHGLFLAQLKLDARDNTFKLIEINARSSGANALSARCGALEVQCAYWEALGAACPSQSPVTLGVYFINEFIDIKSIASMIRYRSGSLTALLRSYVGNTQFGVGSRDDPKPILLLAVQEMRARL